MKHSAGKHLAAVAASWLLAANAGAVDYYSETVVAGGSPAFAINNFGDVCGRNNAVGEAFAIIDDVYVSLPTDQSCRGINDSLQMIFDRRDLVTGELRSYLYEPDPVGAGFVETEIPIIGGQGNVNARAINNAGQVTGWASDASNFARAFIWDKASGISVLGTLGSSSFGNDINETGDIVGNVRIGANVRPFLYTDGVMQDITAVTCTRALAEGINDLGDIVGRCDDAMGNFVPFVLQDGVYQNPIGPFSDQGALRKINNDGVAVGITENSAGGQDAAVWDEVNGLRRLADLRLNNTGSSFGSATDINQNGQIIGGSLLLTPVLNVPPELDTIPDQGTLEGVQLVFTATATDLDGNVFAYSATNVTAGAPDPSLSTLGDATIDPASGVFSWTPDFDQAGNYQVAVTVEDAGTPVETDTQIVNITVGDVNRPPVVDPVGPFDLLVGEQLLVELTGTDPEGDFVEFLLVTGPTGLDIGDGNFMAWTPDATQVGVHEVVVDAVDRAMPPAVTRFSIIITVGESELSPSELLDIILDAVDALPPGQAQAKLRKRTQVAQHLLDKNNIDGTLGNLNALQSQINALVNQGELSEEDAQVLLDLTSQLIALLESLQDS